MSCGQVLQCVWHVFTGHWMSIRQVCASLRALKRPRVIPRPSHPPIFSHLSVLPARSYCPTGSSSAAACPSGSVGCCGEASTYSTCPAGSYCPDKCNQYSCPFGRCAHVIFHTGARRANLPILLSSPANSYCPAGASSASACPSGSYGCCGGASTYSTCTAGSYCPDKCNRYSCPAGYYGASAGLTSSSCTAACRYVNYIVSLPSGGGIPLSYQILLHYIFSMHSLDDISSF